MNACTCAYAAEFEGEQVVPSDLGAFEAHFNMPNNTFNVVGPNNGGYQGEGVLDIEYIMGVAVGVNTTMWCVWGCGAS